MPIFRTYTEETLSFWIRKSIFLCISVINIAGKCLSQQNNQSINFSITVKVLMTLNSVQQYFYCIGKITENGNIYRVFIHGGTYSFIRVHRPRKQSI